MENQLLLQVIQIFRPTRVANLHAIRDKNRQAFMPTPAPIATALHKATKLIAYWR
jgi:hypothetical protein